MLKSKIFFSPETMKLRRKEGFFTGKLRILSPILRAGDGEPNGLQNILF